MEWIDQDLERLIAQEVSPPGKGMTILEIPKDRGHGDLTTNICMMTRGPKGVRGFDWAQQVAVRLHKAVGGDPGLSGIIERVEAVRPGFINFFLHPDYLRSRLTDWIDHPEAVSPKAAQAKRIDIEFVSANPTGPLTIAHGRQAAIGDTLARFFERVGSQVTREYYLNDAGNQIRILGASVRAEYEKLCGRSVAPLENRYKGAYIKAIAAQIYEKHRDQWLKKDGVVALERFSEYAVKEILNNIKRDLKDFGVQFQCWFSEKNELHETGCIQKLLDRLQDNGWIKEEEGALWFQSTRSGDDKDRVVRKSNGSYTYLAPDIAYHENKFKRGFDRVIDILGPDHHGYVPRLRAAVEALGVSKDCLTAIIVQLTTLYRGKVQVRMSTREGEFVTLRELMDEVGCDAARYFFLMRRCDSPLDFDLELAKKHSQDNPVYYVQYAHTRLASLVRRAKDVKRASGSDWARLVERSEIELLRILWQYPYMVAQCARLMAPHLMTVYLKDLSAAFHSFYNRYRVVTDDEGLTRARLELVRAVQSILGDGLGLLGVTAPEKM